MKQLKIHLAVAALGLGLLFGSTAVAQDEWNHYPGLRELVDKTQNDLQQATQLEHGQRQVDRYKNAEDHLSDFDRSLSKGHYDQGRLNKAIDDLKNVVDHNTLTPGVRDALRDDLIKLRMVREYRKH